MVKELNTTAMKTRNGIIIVLVVLIGLFALFGAKRVTKYQDEVTSLKTEKRMLKTQNALLEVKIQTEKIRVELKDRKIDSCMTAFKKKDKVIAGITGELNDVLARLNGITSDSSYQFLQQIAYNFSGTLEYLFNSLQIKGIHTDYLMARSAEKIIPVYQQQVVNCKIQFIERDSIELGLKSIIKDMGTQMDNCEQINNNNDIIIKDTEKQRDKERRRKNFWRVAASIATGVAVIGIL